MRENERRKLGRKKHGPHYIGNVIRILDNRTIVVNAGKSLLKPNEIVQIYEVGDPLIDIDGETICNYEYVKDELEVIFVDELYSVCRKFQTKTTNPLQNVGPLFGTTTKYVPLNVKEENIKPFKPQSDYVNIGDPIKLA